MKCYKCQLILNPANPSICKKHNYGHCATHSNGYNRCPNCFPTGKTSIVNLVNGQVHVAATFDKCLTHEEVCSELIKLSKNNALKGTVLTICYDAKMDSLWLNDVVIA